jgi:hypothetical protein
MNTQTVTVQTARRLAAAGFPQPAPAPGQWWGDESGVVLVFGETIPQPGKYWEDENGVMQPVGGLSLVVHYVDGGRPIIDDYFDSRDFRGLVYLPTVGDILRELPAWLTMSYRNTRYHISGHKHGCEHAAAALAYLELHLQKQG